MCARARADQARFRLALIAGVALLLTAPQAALADIREDLARVDRALKENPGHVSPQILQKCRFMRNDAVRVYNAGREEGAERRLKVCMQELKIIEAAPAPIVEEKAAPSMEEIQARAAQEIERALALEPNIAKGLAIYRTCAECHTPEGWGRQSDQLTIPQLAAQHRTVVIKQLSDIRAGNRESIVMAPYATVEVIGGAQAIADVAGYIDSLEMSMDTAKGPGKDLERGAKLYQDNCARCHGPTGGGDAEKFVPRIQSQHFPYLIRQFGAIRTGKRRNSNPEMVAQVRTFSPHEIEAVLDYVSRLEPPEALRAPPGWRNPDFAR